MRAIIYTIVAIFLATPTVAGVEILRDKEYVLTFEGTVLQIGDSPDRDSGGVEAYQLVKYRISRVCNGRPVGREILVDHLILRSDDLKDLRVRDKVCLSVRRSKTISMRYDAEGLRKASDIVRVYYIGGPVNQNQLAPCSCANR